VRRRSHQQQQQQSADITVTKQPRQHSHQQQQQQQPANITKQPRRHSHQQQQQQADITTQSRRDSQQQQQQQEQEIADITRQSRRDSQQQQQQEQELADIDELLQDSSPPRKRSSHQEQTNRREAAATGTATAWELQHLDLLGADAAAGLLGPKHARQSGGRKVHRSSNKAATAAARDVIAVGAVMAGAGLDELLESSWLDGGIAAASGAAAARLQHAATMQNTERMQRQQQHADMFLLGGDDIFANRHAREASAASAAAKVTAAVEAPVAADDLDGSFPVSPDVQHWQQQCQQQHLSSNLLDEHMCTDAAACTELHAAYRRRSSSTAAAAAAAVTEQQQEQQVLPDIDISLQDYGTPPAATAAAGAACAADDDSWNHSSMASGRLYHDTSDDWVGNLDAGTNQRQQQQQLLLQSLSPTPILAGSLAAVSADSPISFQGLGGTTPNQQQQWRLWQQQNEGQQSHQRKEQQLVGNERLHSSVLQGCSSILEDADVAWLGAYGEQREQETAGQLQLQQEEHMHDQLFQQQQRQQQQHSTRYTAADCGDELYLQLDDEPGLHSRRGSSRVAAAGGPGSSRYAYAALGANSPAGALEDSQREQELEALLLGFDSSKRLMQHEWQQQQQQHVGRDSNTRANGLVQHRLDDSGLLDGEWVVQQVRQDQPHWRQLRQSAPGHHLAGGEMGDDYTPPGVGLAAAAAAAAATQMFGVSPLPSVTEGRSFMTRLQQLLDSPFDGVVAAAQTAAAPAAVTAAESVASGLGEDHHHQQQQQQQQQDLTARHQAVQEEHLLKQQHQQQQHNVQQLLKPADSCETVQQLDQGPEASSRQDGTKLPESTTAAAAAAANTAALPAAAATATARTCQQQQHSGCMPAGPTGGALLLLPFHARLLRSGSPQPKRRCRYATSNSLCSNQPQNCSSSSSRVGRRLRWSVTAVADVAAGAGVGAGGKDASGAASMQFAQQQQQHHHHQQPQQQAVPRGVLGDVSNSAALKAGGTHNTGPRSSTLDKADDCVAGRPAAKQQQQQAQHINEKQQKQKVNARAQKHKQPPAGASLPQQKQLQQAKLPFLPLRSAKPATQADAHAGAAPTAAAAAEAATTAGASASRPAGHEAITHADAIAAITVKQETLWQATPSRARLAASAAAIATAAAAAAKLRSSLSKPRLLQQRGSGAGEAARPRKRVRFDDVLPRETAAGLEGQPQQQQQQYTDAQQPQMAGEGSAAHADEGAAAAAAHAAYSLQAAAAGAAGAESTGASTAVAAAAEAGTAKKDATVKAGAAGKNDAAAEEAGVSAAAAGAASGGMFVSAGPAILSVDDLIRGSSGSLVPGSVSRQQLQQAHTLEQVRRAWATGCRLCRGCSSTRRMWQHCMPVLYTS
jgi:hypothetical protein